MQGVALVDDESLGYGGLRQILPAAIGRALSVVLSFRRFGRLFEAGIMSERERDDHSHEGATGDGDEPPGEGARQILDPAHDEGTEIARKIADRIDRGNARSDRGAGEKCGRQGPQNR